MLGNLKPRFNKKKYLEYDKEYKKYYCSLCSGLRQNNGLKGSLTLSFDMTYIMLGLSHHISDGVESTTLCPSKYFRERRAIIKHKVINLAAHYIIVLAWIKTIDVLIDKDYKNDRAKFMFYFMANKWLFLKSKKVLRSASKTTRLTIENYARLINNDEKDFKIIREATYELAAQISTELMSSIDCPPDFKACYSRICGLTGELVAIYDPIFDLQDDIKSNTYNPIVDKASQDGNSIYSAISDYSMQYSTVEKLLLNEVKKNSSLLNEAFIHHCKRTLEFNNRKVKKAYKMVFDTLFQTELENINPAQQQLTLGAV